MIEYCHGRYIVKDPAGENVGRIDEDEFVRNGMDILYRIDGDKFYVVNGGLVGFIQDGAVHSPNGKLRFRIEAE